MTQPDRSVIEIACCTGQLPFFVRQGPGPIEILDTNGAPILSLDLVPGRGFVVTVTEGVEVDE